MSDILIPNDRYMRLYPILLFIVLLQLFSNGSKGQTEPKDMVVSDEVLRDYLGQYALAPNFILTFTKEGNQLKVSPPGQPALPLSPESKTKFFDKEHPEVNFEFVRGPNGFVRMVVLKQGKEIKEARKLGRNPNFDPSRKFTVAQLKEDIASLKKILEKYHPRPYEFTTKLELNQYFDSLTNAIRGPADEIQFRHYLMPAVAKVHCGHTSLSSSFQLQQYRYTLFQPFVMYYEGNRAFIRNSAYPSLPPGTEVLAINEELISEKILDLLKRVTGDGIHPSVQYYKINQPLSWMEYEMPKWFDIQSYSLKIVGEDKKEKLISVKAISEDQFRRFIPPPRKKRELKVMQDGETALMTYPSFDFPSNSKRDSFLNSTFSELKANHVANLVIDLRGNGGGAPQNAAEFMRYLMRKDFVYSKPSDLQHLNSLTKPISPATNRFTGNIFFLIDGGSFSSTGHLLSLVKYYNLGKLVGELSSGSNSNNTNGEPHYLPNTDLTFNCPHGIFETDVEGYERANGIKPDYEVRNSVQDVIEEKDRVLEFALSLVLEKKQ